ncbi:MAG: prolyl oligopeptidase family serine peptidase [Bryobacteraceae bacterium]|nr:prolyl oligopeptidase family serine peptidase [Bryobacteraceae bacterium]
MFRQLCLLALPMMMTAQIQYPDAPVRPVTETLHGVTLTDPYRWLEEDQAPETRRFVEEQMRLTRSLLDPRADRAAFRQRLTELQRVEKTDVPFVRNGRYFYTKRPAAATREAIYFRASAGSEEVLLVDPAVAAGGDLGSVQLMGVSGDGRWVAYGVRVGGADEQEVRFLNADSRQERGVKLTASRYLEVDLTADGGMVYYSDLPVGGPRVFRLDLRMAGAAPAQLFGQGWGAKMIAVSRLSEDDRHLVVEKFEGSSGDRGEIHVLEIATGRWTALVKGMEARSTARVHNGIAYVMTNWNAPRNRIYRVDLAKPQRHFWRLIVPEGPDAIDEFHLAGGHLLVQTLRNATARVELYTLEGRPVRTLELPGLGTVSGVKASAGSEDVYLQYMSLNTPAQILRYGTAAGGAAVWARTAAPVDSESLEVKQVWFTSKDGTRVPMFLMMRKGTVLDGARPVLLYGYGGFNVSVTPSFSANYVAFAERGGVVAVSNLRGGGEFGEQWHKAGMLENKQNVFDDYIAAAEWLIANKYTNPERLAIYGGSNGGLLVGAALTQRPELYRAVVCTVPLLDMVRFHKFLIAPLWVPEYGSADDPRQFEYIRKYSPYHNVKKGERYPAVLIVTGDSDTRVAPLHARKMAALLQASARPERPVMLHYDTASGHSTGLPVTKVIEDGADVLTFLAWQLGM